MSARRSLAVVLIVVVGVGGWLRWPESVGKTRRSHAAAAENATTTGPAAVIKNQELMKLLFDPYYIDLKRSLADEPSGGKAWRQAYIAAFRICEVSNLLYLRDDKQYMQGDEWRELSDVSRSAAVEVGEAIKKLDYPLARQKYEALIKSCNTCHEKFEPTEPTIVMP